MRWGLRFIGGTEALGPSDKEGLYLLLIHQIANSIRHSGDAENASRSKVRDDEYLISPGAMAVSIFLAPPRGASLSSRRGVENDISYVDVRGARSRPAAASAANPGARI